MTRRWPWEIVLLSVTGVMAVASVVKMFRGQEAIRTVAAIDASVRFTAMSEPFASEAAEPSVQADWLPPAAQSRGPAWRFELFAPPAIEFDPRTRSFSLALPAARGDTPSLPDEVRALVAEPQLFRLQLVGFVGGEGTYRGTFENVASSEHFLARAGTPVPELELTIVEFHVARQRIDDPDTMMATEWVATAWVHDERTGERVRLTHRHRHFVDPRQTVAAQP